MDIVEKDRERYRKMFGEKDRQKEYWVYKYPVSSNPGTVSRTSNWSTDRGSS
jgi:hypothetical protein